jgi:hypothetical protein
MSTRVISSISYKDTSDDKVDVALQKLRCPRTFIGNRQLIRVETLSAVYKCNEPLSVATRISDEDPLLLAIAPQGQLSKTGRAI